MRFADKRIFLFDLGEAILPPRPQFNCAVVSSGGQGWPPLGGHPKGLSLTAASTAAGLGARGQMTISTASRLHFPCPLQQSGSGSGEPINCRARGLIKKRDPAHEKGRSGYSYSGLCLTSLPHRKLADDQPWERSVGPLTLIVEPGRIKLGDGPAKLLGVPHGARARLILIYLQTQAVLTNSREVSLGRSMRGWMGRMGLSVGGETASALREQARRIATWHRCGSHGRRWAKPATMLRR